MKRRSPARQGLATIMALAMVGIVGAAALAVTSSLAADYRRTRLAMEDAQLRQVLLAGQLAVQEKAKGWQESPELSEWKILLPAQGTPSPASLTMAGRVENGRIIFRVQAAMDRRRAAQEIRMERGNDRWRITGLELAP